MQALIDGIVFQNTYQKGIQRYWREVVTRIATYNDAHISLLMNREPAVALPPGTETVDHSDWEWHASDGKIKRLMRKTRRSIRRKRFPSSDLFHSTYYTRSPVPTLPEVLTVHDMIPETVPHFFWGDADVEIAIKRGCIEAAAAIITISSATRDDLVRIYPDVAERVTVVHHGAEHLLANPVGIQADLPDGKEPYILFVGDRAGYKNFAIMMDSLQESAWPKGFRLAVVGRPFSEAEKTALRYRGIASRVVHMGRVSDQELRDIYCRSSGFVFPSVAEGFGFPILEAQSLGVPVAASDIPVFHEVGGNAFVPFPPLDSGKLAKAVAHLVEPTTRDLLTLNGIENTKRFSWERCAEETFKVWKSCLGRGDSKKVI